MLFMLVELISYITYIFTSQFDIESLSEADVSSVNPQFALDENSGATSVEDMATASNSTDTIVRGGERIHFLNVKQQNISSDKEGSGKFGLENSSKESSCDHSELISEISKLAKNGTNIFIESKIDFSLMERILDHLKSNPQGINENIARLLKELLVKLREFLNSDYAKLVEVEISKRCLDDKINLQNMTNAEAIGDIFQNIPCDWNENLKNIIVQAIERSEEEVEASDTEKAGSLKDLINTGENTLLELLSSSEFFTDEKKEFINRLIATFVESADNLVEDAENASQAGGDFIYEGLQNHVHDTQASFE